MTSYEWVGPKKCWRNIWMVPKRPPDWPTDVTARQRAKAHHEFPQVFHFICFHFTRNFFPHINSYNINIDNFHANELVATVIGISQRLCCCLQNTQEFMAYFTCFGRAFVILWTSEWVVSVWKRSTILIFWINIKLTLIDSMNLFNARQFCNSVHLMNL